MAYFELNIALLRQRARNNFIQALMASDNDTIRATPRYRPCKKIHFWIRLALRVRSLWWHNFVNNFVGPEEWRENFKMTRKNLLKLKLPKFESKQPPKTL